VATVAHGLLAGLDDIAHVGRDRLRGGYSRHGFSSTDLELRDWFSQQAGAAGLDVETDRNGNLWAWWGVPGDDALVLGSHLDSVPGGGAYDGPLGIVSALDAVATLAREGFVPARPVAILVFVEEEGSRFGVACLGSRLMTGSIDSMDALRLTDQNDITLAKAVRSVGLDPHRMGRDEAALARIGTFIELHVEQGRGLIDLDRPLGVASTILAHGRWRLTVSGQGNHAGATDMTDRRDPVVTAAQAILAINDAARSAPGSRATVGRLQVVPGGTNVIASRVHAWLDARASTDRQTRDLVSTISARLDTIALESGTAVSMTEESWTSLVHFDASLAAHTAGLLGDVPLLASGAGHDAGVLAGHRPSAMVFVRNPTGVSHSPEEFAELSDCIAGVDALITLVRELA